MYWSKVSAKQKIAKIIKTNFSLYCILYTWTVHCTRRREYLKGLYPLYLNCTWRREYLKGLYHLYLNCTLYTEKRIFKGIVSFIPELYMEKRIFKGIVSSIPELYMEKRIFKGIVTPRWHKICIQPRTVWKKTLKVCFLKYVFVLNQLNLIR